MLSVVVHAAPGFDDYTFHFANALSKHARVGYVIDSKQRDRFGNALSNAITPITFNRPRRRELWGLQEMYRVSKAIRQFSPDVFHLQNFGLWESVLLRMIGKTPVINTVHDPILHIDYRNHLNDVLTRDAIHKANGWVIHSEGLMQIFLDKYGVSSERILIHPLGVHDYYCRFIPAGIRRENYILFFGELRVNKGFDLLVSAFNSTKDQLDDWKLVIAGKGTLRKSLKDLICQLGNRVIFQNRYITDAEVASLFAHAGIVALPYRHGSQSAVLGIAAAFGCPVLATPVGNMAEIMRNQEHSLFVEPDNERALAKGLIQLVRDEELRTRLGTNLANLARSEWSWDKIAERTLEFYEKILQS